MKIPVVTQRVNIPAGFHQPQQTGAIPAAARGVAQAVEQVGQGVQYAAAAHQDAARAEELRRSRLEADDLEAQWQVAFSLSAQQHATVTDPEAYTQAIAETLRGTREEILKRVKQPFTRQLLDAKINNHYSAELKKALGHAQQLRKDNTTATVTRTLDNLETLAGQVPLTDDATFAQLIARGEGVLADAAPEIGQDAAEKLRIARRERMFGERAERHSREDPDSFIQDVDRRYHGLDPMKRNQLVRSAENAIEARRKNDIAEEEKRQRKLEKDAEAARQVKLTEMESEGQAGALTVQKVETARIERTITTPEEYSRFYKLATDVAERKSNPDVQRQVDLAVTQQRPTISMGQLDRYYDTGKLNRADYLAAKKTLIGRRDAIANEEQAEAEQQLQLAVGKSPYDTYDDADGQLLKIARDELSRRSNAFPENGGNEAPLAVAREIIDKFIVPNRRARMQAAIPEIATRLRYPAATATEAMARLNEHRKTLPKDIIAQETEKIAAMTRAEFAAGVGSSTPTTQQKSTTSQGTGARKSLRPKGTKAESGTAEDK